MRRITILTLAFGVLGLACNILIAQSPSQPYLDVLHYDFKLTLNDSTNKIEGEASIRVKIQMPVKEVSFDLVGSRPDGKGMKVKGFYEDTEPREVTQSDDKIAFSPSMTMANLERTYLIQYEGIPADGLIITTLPSGGKTFFGDNWPNRAHNYLPCIDHPSDKATVNFTVTAPAKYLVVSNGLQTEATELPDGRKRTHYTAKTQLPTKVMVVGVGEFAVKDLESRSKVPVSLWVFPEQRENGFKEYQRAVPVLDFFENLIAPYPFEKLANVQSRTRFGGMENAGCIFYHEHSATGDGSSESLIVHEIAHQWFGNTVTETDWQHLWLSEGFATYLTHIYHERNYGRTAFLKRMRTDREVISKFPGTWTNPVVDSTVTNYMTLLNPNSYEKGGWVLHMLRHEIGDSAFFKTLKTFYARHKYGNAATADFRQTAEKESGKDLTEFFRQWLYQKGHPKLDIRWSYKKGSKMATVTVDQQQAQPFRFNLDISCTLKSGDVVNQNLLISQAKESFQFELASPPIKVEADPDVKLLWQGKVAEAGK